MSVRIPESVLTTCCGQRRWQSYLQNRRETRHHRKKDQRGLSSDARNFDREIHGPGNSNGGPIQMDYLMSRVRMSRRAPGSQANWAIKTRRRSSEIRKSPSLLIKSTPELNPRTQHLLLYQFLHDEFLNGGDELSLLRVMSSATCCFQAFTAARIIDRMFLLGTGILSCCYYRDSLTH